MVLLDGQTETHSFEYSTVQGFFLQNEPSTDPSSFDYTAVDFGLIEKSYNDDDEYDPDHRKTQWQRFANNVSTLNHQSGPTVQYKVLYMVRIWPDIL